MCVKYSIVFSYLEKRKKPRQAVARRGRSKRKEDGLLLPQRQEFCRVHGFLMAGDGTPYDILYNLFNGNKVLYPLSVVGLFLLYITGYYLVYFAITKRSKNPALAQ